MITLIDYNYFSLSSLLLLQGFGGSSMVNAEENKINCVVGHGTLGVALGGVEGSSAALPFLGGGLVGLWWLAWSSSVLIRHESARGLCVQ